MILHHNIFSTNSNKDLKKIQKYVLIITKLSTGSFLPNMNLYWQSIQDLLYRSKNASLI